MQALQASLGDIFSVTVRIQAKFGAFVLRFGGLYMVPQYLYHLILAFVKAMLESLARMCNVY